MTAPPPAGPGLAPAPARARLPRWATWLLGLGLGVVVVIAAGLFALRQPPVSTRLVRAFLVRFQPLPRARVTATEVRGDVVTGLELRGVRIVRGDTLLVSVDTLRARYDLPSLIAGDFAVHELIVDGVWVTADIVDTTRSRPPPPKRPLTLADVLRGRFYGGPALHVDRLALRHARYGGTSAVPDSGMRLTDVRLEARQVRLGRGFSFALDTLAVSGRSARQRGADVRLGLAAQLDRGRFEARSLRLQSDASAIDGRLVVGLDARDSLAETRLDLEARPWSLADLEALIPGFALDGAVEAEVSVHGPRADRLSGTLALTANDARWGDIDLDATRLNATLTDGRADTRLSLTSGGARIEVAGWLRPFDRAPAYDLEARTDRLPARIPGAAWWPAFAARIPATAVTLRAEGIGFARPATNVTGHIGGDAGDIDLDGRLDFTRGFAWEARRLVFDQVDVARLTGDTTSSVVSGTLTGSGQDVSPNRKRMTARLDLEPSSYGAWQLASGHARVRVDGNNVAGSLSVETDGGVVALDSLTGRWDAAGTLRLVEARFHDVDLERLTRQPALASRLGGTLRGTLHGLGALAGSGGANAALRDGKVSGDLRVELEPSRFRAQEITAGSVSLKLARGNVDVDGTIESTAGRVGVDARARPFDASPRYVLNRGRFDDVDLAAWTGSAALRSRLSGTVSGEGRPGAKPGSSGTWESKLELDPSTFAGTGLEGGGARATWSEGRASLVADLRAAGDRVSATADLVVRDKVPEGRADVTVPLRLMAGLMGRDSLETTGQLVARASFHGLTPATATADGDVIGRGSVDRVRLDSLFAGFHLRQGTLTLDTLLALSNVGEARGAGRVALFDTTAAARSDLSVRLAFNDVTPLRALLRADTLAVDTASAVVTLRGTGRTRSFEVKSTVTSFAWNKVRLLGSDGSAQGEFDASWRLTRAHAEASLRRLYGLGIPVNQAVARADLDSGRTRFDLTAHRDESHHLRLVGVALGDSLGQHVTLDRMDLRSDSAAWALSRPAKLSFGPTRFEVQDFDLRSASGRIEASGVIDRRGEQSFRLTMNNVGLDAVSAWLGRPDATGMLNGKLALNGPAAAPRGDGDFQLDLTTDGKPAATVRSRLTWNGARLDFDGQFATPKHDSLTWTGNLPLTVSLAVTDSGKAASMRVVEGEVDVQVHAVHFPLAAFSPLLDPHAVGEMDGTLDLDARLRGSSKAIVGDGRVDVTGGVVPMPALGTTYRDLEFHGVFQGDRLRVQKAHAASQKGSLDASGELRFVGVTRVEPKLHVTSDQFVFVQSPDLRAIGSGSVDITGTLTSPIVRGKAKIMNSSFYLTPPQATAGEPGATVRLTEADVRMLQENFGDVKAETPNVVLQLYDASDLDLAITLERNNWVRQRVRPKLSVALTGDFTLKKAPHGEPQMFGRIEPIARRGYVEEFARSFDIAGGDILLNGPMTDHRVDIQAEYKPPSSSESDEDETVIKLDVEGTIEKLHLTLSSEPPMSEVEIVNYIATGHSAADKSPGSSQETSSLAKDIGLSQVTGFAEEAAQEAIGLDVLQVRFDALQGATLVAGRYLDSQLYVGFRQPLQYNDNGSSTSGEQQRTSVEVEYAVYQWLVLNLQGETSKVRSFIRARHAY